MERLQVEIAARPMRTFALGIVGILGAVVAMVALCVTVIGVPVALIAALLFALGTFAGTCAVVETLGKAVSAHRSQSTYVHLAVGCAFFLVASAIPYIGPIVMSVVAIIGIGSLVATRAAGLVPMRGLGQAPSQPPMV
jgi:hypothetical protein